MKNNFFIIRKEFSLTARAFHSGTVRACAARGYRPFSAENCPLDSFPGATNPV